MGKVTRPGLHLEFELEDGYAALGFINEMTTQISTDYFLNDVIEYAHANMAQDFDYQVNAVAMSNPEKFNHVYETGQIGNEEMKLWEHTLYGRGKRRQASFEWKEATLPIESPRERARNPKDPMSKVPSDVIDKLSDRNYVFRLKAPIMEYRMRVNVTPKYAKFLFIPTFALNYRRGNKNEGWLKPSNFRFEKHNIPDWSYSNPQEPSGSDGTVGQFTEQWVSYWGGGGADDTWRTNVQKVIEKNMGEAEIAMPSSARRRTRKRVSTASITAFASNDAAFEAGANLARAFIRGKAKSYADAAKYIKKKGFFGGDMEF